MSGRERIVGDFYVEHVLMMDVSMRWELTHYTGAGYKALFTTRTRGEATAFARKEWKAILKQQHNERYRIRGY